MFSYRKFPAIQTKLADTKMELILHVHRKTVELAVLKKTKKSKLTEFVEFDIHKMLE